jgi:trypsin
MKKIILLGIFLTTFALSNGYETRVINGTEVLDSNEEWRSIVSLKWQDNHYCGGTLIAPTWVLTAAHCMVDDNNIPYNVEIGDTIGIGNYNLNTMREYTPKRFIVHPLYNSNITDNDIALIELENIVTEVNPIRYDTNNPLSSNTQTKTAGWGNTLTTGENYPKDLREALVPIVDRDICNSYNAYNGRITLNMICEGYMTSTRDSCQGDSGGPLIVNKTLVGIVSWGENCAQTNFPGVYTKVQNYETWIRSYTPYEVDEPKNNIAGVLPAILSILLK